MARNKRRGGGLNDDPHRKIRRRICGLSPQRIVHREKRKDGGQLPRPSAPLPWLLDRRPRGRTEKRSRLRRCAFLPRRAHARGRCGLHGAAVPCGTPGLFRGVGKAPLRPRTVLPRKPGGHRILPHRQETPLRHDFVGRASPRTAPLPPPGSCKKNDLAPQLRIRGADPCH